MGRIQGSGFRIQKAEAGNRKAEGSWQGRLDLDAEIITLIPQVATLAPARTGRVGLRIIVWLVFGLLVFDALFLPHFNSP